jgi:L-threonylcarbamoyladenylate synthase
VPRWLSGGRGTVAVRLTDHPIAAELCARVGGAIVSTSANVSRRPPLRTARLVRRELGAQLDYVLPGYVGGLANPTVIRDGRTGRVLRG